MLRGGECNGKFFGNATMMTSGWQRLLEHAGAQIAAGEVQDFGSPEHESRMAESGEVIADLSHRALIAVRGADAEAFLQGQLTNDIHGVNTSHSQLSAHCTPKGRVLSLLRVFRRDDLLYLALPEALLQGTLARLRKYVLMSKVRLEPDNALAQMGYSDATGADHLRECLAPLPEAIDTVTRSGEITILRVPGPYPRYELIGPPMSLGSLWDALRVHAAPVGAGPWELLDILGGVPVLHPETLEAFVPQMLNLDVFSGINFKKGCYTGQEIVARTHYLGKLKRRMFRLYCAAEPPPPATPLFNTAHREDEGVGVVAAARPAPNGGAALLAVLQVEATTQGELHLGRLDGPLCTVQPLPYSLESASR